MNDILSKFNYMETHYKMQIPAVYKEFAEKIGYFDYADSLITANGMEIELNHFLLVDEKYPSRDILDWYCLSSDGREDFLTIAMGYGNEEIAIKVRRGGVGGIYYVDQREDLKIIKMFDCFEDLLKQIKK